MHGRPPVRPSARLGAAGEAATGGFSSPSTGRRIPGIEGLRALAALSIVVVHVWSEGSPSGPPSFGAHLDERFLDLSYGVTLFFTLSGFLLYRPLTVVLLDGSGQLRIGSYLRNRALRILPAYWVVLLVCGLGIGGLLRRSGSRLVDGRLTDPTLLLETALLVQNYDPRTLLTGIGPAWTLAVEVVFYLLLPVLAWLAWRAGRSSGRSRVGLALAPPALLLLVGAVGKAVTGFLVPADLITSGWETDWHSVLERSFFCQADLFSFGMALAVLHTLQRNGRLQFPRWWRPLGWLGAVGAYLGCAKASAYGAQLSYSPWNTLMALACTCLLALVVMNPQRGTALVRVLEIRPLVLAGTVSYSVFLWHHPLVLAARRHGLTLDGRQGFLLNLLVIVVTTLFVSFLTYRLVEAPALRLKRRRAVTAHDSGEVRSAPPSVPAVPEKGVSRGE